jgi:hypothetical protein
LLCCFFNNYLKKGEVKGFFFLYMAKPTNRSSNSANKTSPSTKLERVLGSYALHITPEARPFMVIGILLFFWGVLGLIWMIPFPEIGFLKSWNLHLYLNWASFLIAFGIYYYLRIAPTLSYGVLLQLGIYSYLIVQIEYWYDRGGPQEWIVFLIISIIGFIILLFTKQKATKPISLGSSLELIGHGPLWVWHLVFKRLKLPF